MYPDEQVEQILNQSDFNQTLRPIVKKALTKDVPYWTAIIWVHSNEQQNWGHALTEDVAQSLQADEQLRQTDRIIYLYIPSMSQSLPLGTIIWLINYHDPQVSRKNVPDFRYDMPMRFRPRE